MFVFKGVKSIASSTINEFSLALNAEDDEDEDGDGTPLSRPSREGARLPAKDLEDDDLSPVRQRWKPSPADLLAGSSPERVDLPPAPPSASEVVEQLTADLVDTPPSASELVQHLAADLGKTAEQLPAQPPVENGVQVFAMDADDSPAKPTVQSDVHSLGIDDTCSQPKLPSLAEAVSGDALGGGTQDDAMTAATDAPGAPQQDFTTEVEAVHAPEGGDPLAALLLALEPDDPSGHSVEESPSLEDRAARIAREAREAKRAWRTLGQSAWEPCRQLSVPALAQRCAGNASQSSATQQDNGTSQKLLNSFSERYDALLAQYKALQVRCRESLEDAQKTSDKWRNAASECQGRLEALLLENAGLKEEKRVAKADPAEITKVREKLKAREAELVQASKALSDLQEVFEDTSDHSRETEALRTRAVTAERQAEEAKAALLEERRLSEDRRRTQATANEGEKQEHTVKLQAELDDLKLTLTTLLDAKEKDLREREQLVDRNLVLQMVQNYLAHTQADTSSVSSLLRSHELGQQILSQVVFVLGGSEDQSDRARLIKEAREKIQNRPVAPLQEAFAEFLEEDLAGRPAGPHF